MFNNYILKNNILYLEIDLNYEFSYFSKNKNRSIIDYIKQYIKNNKIGNNFKKIIITCSGIIIGSIIFLNNKNNIISEENIRYVPSLKNEIICISNNSELEEPSINTQTEYNTDTTSNQIYTNTNTTTNNSKQSNLNDSNNIPQENIQNNETIITVKRSNGNIININLEKYIIGVIAAEMPASFNIEALKSQAVVARTYALKAKNGGKILTDTVSTQSYIDENEMRNKWGSEFDKYYNKIKNAVNATNGEYLTYNGNYIEALYHSTNNGKTESSLDVFGNYYPYLISVTSEFDKSASSYLRETNFDFNTISSKLGINFNNDSIIEILSYTDGNNIREISIDGKIFSGKLFRELLGLRSADFDILIENNSVKIITRGFGHGVGMSQYGANGMANAGYSYQNILSHYYPNTTLKK